MSSLVKDKLCEVLRSVAPLIGVVIVFQFTLVRAPTELFFQFLVGSAMTVAGLVLFFLGIDIGVLPMGKFIGAELPRRNSVFVILFAPFLLSFSTTVAEPDVLVLAKKVSEISNGTVTKHSILYLTGIGVGVFAAVGMLRIILGFPISRLLIVSYGVMVALTLFAPERLIALSYDAGSVTTGALTAPVVLAMAIGLSSVLSNRSALTDGFGILGFGSIGPVIIILLMGALFF